MVVSNKQRIATLFKNIIPKNVVVSVGMKMKDRSAKVLTIRDGMMLTADVSAEPILQKAVQLVLNLI